jgi:glutathione S-transferase
VSGLPVLYTFRRCPYAIRARLALALAGIAYEPREVSLRAKPPDLLIVSPKGTVPVLVVQPGVVIEESLDIMRWALRRTDLCSVSQSDAETIRACDTTFKPALDGYKYGERTVVGASSQRDVCLGFLAEIERRLAGAPQLGGQRPGQVDLAVMPFVRQFAAVQPAWFAKQPLPNVQHWLHEHLRSSLFVQVMQAPAQGGLL